MDVDSLRLTGSCEWLMRKTALLQWRDSATPRLYRISAKPATGQTILSGMVVHHLKCLTTPHSCRAYVKSCLLDVVYRDQDILLWELEGYALYNSYHRKAVR